MYRWNSRGYNNNNNHQNTTSNYNGNNLTSSSTNLSEFSTTSVISTRGWIWNALKTFFSLLSVFHSRRVVQKVNPINYSNCLFSSQTNTNTDTSTTPKTSLTFCCYLGKSNSLEVNTSPAADLPTTSNTIPTLSTTTTGSISSGDISSEIVNNNNNCNIPGAKNKLKPRIGKMAQILSKTMTLLGVAFLIHFIIMSTFAEREVYPHGYSGPAAEGSRHHGYDTHSNSHSHSHSSRRAQRSFRNEKHMSTPEENTLAPPPRFHNKSEAMFFTENSTVITAQIGSKTYLPCAVRNLGSGVASWIRRRDYTLLTVGMGTYSNDDRFIVSHNRAAQSWELHIKFVKESDSGVYECQISTHPPSSLFIHLTIVEAKAEILGEPDKHVRSGSTFELVCVLRDSTEPPVYVFWYHNDRMINYDNVRRVVVNSDLEKSLLTIQDAQKSDSGNYTCVPSNARPTSISVHILNGEKPAAMQHGSRNHSGRQVASSMCLLFVTAFAVFILTTWLVTTNLNQNLYQQQQHYYLRQEDAPPLPKPIEPNSQEEADCATTTTISDVATTTVSTTAAFTTDTATTPIITDLENLRIVQICSESAQAVGTTTAPPLEGCIQEGSSIHKDLLLQLLVVVEDGEGACLDKDDIRFETKLARLEAALQAESLTPKSSINTNTTTITTTTTSRLSVPRYCIMEVVARYQPKSETATNANMGKSLSQDFRTFSASTSFLSVADATEDSDSALAISISSSSIRPTTTTTSPDVSSIILSKASSQDLSAVVKSLELPSSLKDSLVPLFPSESSKTLLSIFFLNIISSGSQLPMYYYNYYYQFYQSFAQSSKQLSQSSQMIRPFVSR